MNNTGAIGSYNNNPSLYFRRDVAGEIAALTVKTTPIAGDFILIEDSEAVLNKKSVTVTNLVKDSVMSITAGSTTNNVNTTTHGFVPVAPNDATKFLDGTAAYDTVKTKTLKLLKIISKTGD